MTSLVLNRLIWDAWNVEHIARHGVTPEEVYVVCQGQIIVRQTYEARLMVLALTRRGGCWRSSGPTSGGRGLLPCHGQGGGQEGTTAVQH